ncbi:hypothetical protein TVAG_180340 [Trichomonas vaginalis G3]|uniref:Uncharacterized protein n=1 Tax=Trichomonas vaginalis (strain ATCC PRA-98 / G3) TaxID=412133 RepID=A2EE63_TRIV3|nr:hypothetical protein TVAGG3_0614270 [Trichomonas vaginalis G3]EAY09060.1 hypothetical protein TVAG_180340 [Trichomonas vaginalis G3]KAI5503424.1 hypothetical protein TVAGG3_0614270 [Trichomonas vaginalis G3]|eukprot:XP_001321283.1 hypothetical protein [Trichomonas vaginalis G3]
MKKGQQLGELDAMSRSRTKRVALTKKIRSDYLDEIRDIVHQTDFLLKHTNAPPRRLPGWLSSPKPIEKIVVKIPEDPEEKYRFLNTPPKSLTPKRPLKKVHLTKRFNGGVDDYVYTSKVKLSKLEDEYPQKDEQLTPQKDEFDEEEMILSPASENSETEKIVMENAEEEKANKIEELITEKMNDTMDELIEIFDEPKPARSESFENSPLALNHQKENSPEEEEKIEKPTNQDNKFNTPTKSDEIHEEEEEIILPGSPDALNKDIFAQESSDADSDINFEVDALIEKYKNMN